MSFREKSAWITLAAIALVCLMFFSHGPGVFVPEPGAATFPILIYCFLVFIAIEIIAHIAVAARSPKDAVAPKDEREQLIDLKATRIAAYVYVAGTFVAVLTLNLGAGGKAVGYFVVLAFVLAELVSNTARIVYYRRGS